jgi:hypothetical protein
MSSVTRGRRELWDAVFSWKDVLVFACVVRMLLLFFGWGEMKLWARLYCAILIFCLIARGCCLGCSLGVRDPKTAREVFSSTDDTRGGVRLLRRYLWYASLLAHRSFEGRMWWRFSNCIERRPAWHFTSLAWPW